MTTIQQLLDGVALGSLFALMAVGIGLVFGVLRLINFAYGQLIMAGAYALALTSDKSPAVSILICFGVVIGLTAVLDVAVFRPLREATPPRMLVATFAVSFLLQSIAVVKFGTIPKFVSPLPKLNQPVTIGSLHVRWITIVTIIVALVALGGLALLLEKTTLGLQMRAAAVDFQTARLLGVRANAVITLAVLFSGLIAAAVAVILPIASTPIVTPDFALRETIIVLVGVVVGGIDRLWTATLGGFAIGFCTSFFDAKLPVYGLGNRIYLDSVIYVLVILVLLLRPSGLFAPRRQSAVERA